MAERPTLLIRTKGDLHPEPATEGVTVSVNTGQGLEALRSAAAELVFGERIALGDLEPTLTSERHRVALHRAQEALAESLGQLGPDGDAVLASHHVREATLALDELVGIVDIEEVLGRVFAGFCVGK